MTHNFVTTKYQEVDGIMVNSDPNRFCILSTPPEFNKKQDFADEIEILCDNLREKKSNFIYKNNLNNICHFFRDGLLLFPFNNLYAIPRSISSLMGQDLLNTNKKIISQINNHSNSKKNDFDHS